jgi:hypothetical protein
LPLSWPSCGFQRGHFLASVESSGTSTTSLSLRSKRFSQEGSQEEQNEDNTHTTSSPANRRRFSILTMRLGSLSGSPGGGALSESWNLAHNARRSLRLSKTVLAQKDVDTYLLAAAESSGPRGGVETRGRLVSRSSSVSESECKDL